MKEMSRRNFIKSASLTMGALGVLPGNIISAYDRPQVNAISLALFSLNRSYDAGLWTLLDIPEICRNDFKIDGIEYVTKYFPDVRDYYLKELNQRVADNGLKNVLIMVDREGDMASKDKKERMQSAINHRKWVEIAAHLGCHAIRCNATGSGKSVEEDPDALDRAEESFSALLEYAREFKINILIENHGGGLASNANWLSALAKKLDDPNFGLLPDYGNYRRSDADAEFIYQSVKQNMPWAKGVSVKGGWDVNGNHLYFDLAKCLEISLESGYRGFWGIESGIRSTDRSALDKLSPDEKKKLDWQAVRWTKAVIDKTVFGK
jgi:sugar phosphate isomerase/epimerase